MSLCLIEALLVVMAVPQKPAGEVRDPCTSMDYRRTQAIASKPRTWDALYRVYKEQGRCEDVDAAEGLSEAVARILVDRWSTLPRLARLARDGGFRRFVLGHINATLDMKDVRTIGVMAADQCPAGFHRLCADIQHQVQAAKAEDASYRERKK